MTNDFYFHVSIYVQMSLDSVMSGHINLIYNIKTITHL